MLFFVLSGSIDLIVNTLSALQHLHHVRFHDDVACLSNPVCHLAVYRRTTVDSLTSLITLDGIYIYQYLTALRVN